MSSSCTLLFLAIGGVMSVNLCQPIVSQAPQHFRSPATQATCGGCFSRQSVYSVISLHSDMSRAVHPQETSRWIPNTYAASLDLPVHSWLYENSSAFSDTHDTTRRAKTSKPKYFTDANLNVKRREYFQGRYFGSIKMGRGGIDLGGGGEGGRQKRGGRIKGDRGCSEWHQQHESYSSEPSLVGARMPHGSP